MPAAKPAPAIKGRKEVEENPFRSMIDVSDLVELERQPAQVEREVQNILLRFIGPVKNWYKLYSRKVENTKSEESFAMTLRQLWRFLRDCGLISRTVTLARIDRAFNLGRKNHYSMITEKDKHRFSVLAAKGPGEWRPTTEPGSVERPLEEEAKGADTIDLSGASAGEPIEKKELPPPSGKIDDASIIVSNRIELDKAVRAESESEDEAPPELLAMEAEDIHAASK